MDESDLNKIIVGVATKTLADIFKGTVNASINVWKWFKNKSDAQDFLDTATRNYAEKFVELNNRIKIIGQTEPTPLTDIYVRVNILEKITSWQCLTPETLEEWEKEYRKRESFGKTKEEGVDGLKLANVKPHLMLLGQPGGGKTTFLKHIGIQTLQGKLDQNLIPVFVSLKALADSGQKLEEYLALVFDVCNLPQAELFIEKQLKDGKLYLLLDGLDEVGKSKIDDVYKDVNDFCDKYSQNKFIISCRTAAYNQNFPLFTDVELSDFSDPQIDNFVKNWFQDNKDKSEICIKKLHLEENKPILELAKRPLLLALLCLAYDETMDFPPNRAELYEDAIDALLRKWDTSRNILRDEIYRHLSRRRKEELLSKIAYETFEDEKYFIKENALALQITEFIKNLPDAKADTLAPDSNVVLKAIEAQHGILVERTHNVFSFSHLTFQEYFTARYIKDNPDKGIISKLINNITDPRWREVFLLTAGMLPQADNFLLLMKEKTDALIQDDDLKKLLVWAVNKAEFINTKDLPAFARSFYLYLAVPLNRNPNSVINSASVLVFAFDSNCTLGRGLRSLDSDLVNVLDHALSYPFDRHLDSLLARALDGAQKNKINSLVESLEKLKRQVPSKNTSEEKKPAWAEGLRKVMIRERDIGHKLELNPEQASCLQDYLYANKLIMDCLNCGSYITKDVREDILDKLLIPPSLEATKVVVIK